MIYEWTVIGAGPAGIAAVGKLLDLGIAGKQIAWIDRTFTVGDFGTLWRNVPSNTRVKLFIQFLNACQSFNYSNSASAFEINRIDPETTCSLCVMAEPLQSVTDNLKNTVNAITAFAENLFFINHTWHIGLEKSTIQAKNVILAIGAEPKSLPFPSLPVIPLSAGMDGTQITKHITNDDTIAVFGSSHSAVLALRNLVEIKAKHIINFYRSPLQYAVFLDNQILFDDTGLKGSTADWAHEHLDGTLPDNLTRVYSNEENLAHYLPQCNKIIYAIGFERRLKPLIPDFEQFKYDAQSGIIAPGLFGVGIAFPQAKYNSAGLLEHRVGLWKFMDYLNNIMPMWLECHVQPQL